MIIDLHNHTTKYSACSLISPDELVRIYIKANINGICITEHNKIWNEKEQIQFKKKYEDEIKIFFGAELSTDVGHVLFFSIEPHDFNDFTTLDVLIKSIDRDKTALVWAHPFRWDTPSLDLQKEISSDELLNQNILDKFDAIELYNGNLSTQRLNLTISKFKKFNVKTIGGSDTHSKDTVLRYATQFKNIINTQEELINNIKFNEFAPTSLSSNS